MQLVNHTRLPNETLRGALAEAARQVGAKTSAVLVRVRWGAGWALRSRAYTDAIGWTLRVPGRRSRERRYPCDRAIDLALPREDWLGLRDSLEWAQDVYRTACHEWAHIADAQEGRRFGDYDLPWAEREHEQRASAAASLAMNRLTLRRQEAILALGIAHEEWRNGRKSEESGRTRRKRLRRRVYKRRSVGEMG